MPRGYFFTAVLALNNNGEIALFDIKLKRKTHGTNVSIYLVTSDIPPIPVNHDDVVRVAFFLENSGGSAPVRIKMAEGTFYGHLLENKLQSNSALIVRTEGTEWQFGKMALPAEPDSSLRSSGGASSDTSAGMNTTSSTATSPTTGAASTSPSNTSSAGATTVGSTMSMTDGQPTPSVCYLSTITAKVPEMRAKEYLSMSKLDV